MRFRVAPAVVFTEHTFGRFTAGISLLLKVYVLMKMLRLLALVTSAPFFMGCVSLGVGSATTFAANRSQANVHQGAAFGVSVHSKGPTVQGGAEMQLQARAGLKNDSILWRASATGGFVHEPLRYEGRMGYNVQALAHVGRAYVGDNSHPALGAGLRFGLPIGLDARVEPWEAARIVEPIHQIEPQIQSDVLVPIGRGLSAQPQVTFQVNVLYRVTVSSALLP
jgi:hypothetical protein